MLLNRLTIVIALDTVALILISWVATPGDTGVAQLVGDEVGLMFFGAWTLGALPLAFLMPRVRAGLFSRAWHVPSQAYVFSRWMVRLIIGFLLGQVVGFSIVAAFWNLRLFWIAGSTMFILLAFSAGAWDRLSKHACTEFEISWLPRGLFRS